MLVIRLAQVLPLQLFRSVINFPIVHSCSSSSEKCSLPPLSEFLAFAQFLKELATGHQASPSRIDPLKESLPSLRASTGLEHFGHNVCIKNYAHRLESERPLCFLHKKLAIARRSVQDISQVVQSERMNEYVQFPALKEQYGNVVWL